MNSAFLTVLTKFKKDGLLKLIEKWDSIGIDDFRNGVEEVTELNAMSKKDIMKKLLLIAKAKNFGKAEVHKIDLKYVQTYSTKKLWIMHQLGKLPGTQYGIQEAEEFGRRLQQQLKFYYKVEFQLNVYKQAFWMRIAIRQPNKEAAPFYVVYYPNTDFFAVTGLKATHKQGFAQSFLNVLDCHSMEMLQLKGYHLYSLFQMVCNRHNQGEFDQYKEEFKEDILHTRTRSGGKRNLSDDEDEHDDILYEDSSLKKKRRAVLDKTFGVSELPVLQKVEYKLDTKFRGAEYAPPMQGQMFHCKIKFEGSNVLEGIKKLGEAGLAALPMKSHVGKIHMLARNNFNLRMKSNSNNTNVETSTANTTSQLTPAKQGNT